MKRKILLLSLLSLITLVGCSKNPTDHNNDDENIKKDESVEMSLEDMLGVLDEAIINESTKASETLFESTYTKSDLTQQIREKYVIGQNKVTKILGNVKKSYEKTPSFDYEDNYEGVIGVKNINNSSILYYVTDYELGTGGNDYKDSAYRMAIVPDGTTGGEDGVDFLYESSVDKQLTKQVSAITYNFIVGNLISNPDLASYNLIGKKTTTANYVTYELKDFAYETSDDGIKIQYKYDFEFRVDLEGKLIDSYTKTSIYEERINDSSDNLLTVLEDNYKLSYDTKKDIKYNEDAINPTDYFLSEVNDVEVYYFEGNEKVVCSLDSIPVGKIIWFVAKTYSPSKAVNLELRPASINSSTNTNVIEGSTYSFEAKRAGSAKITLTSVGEDVTLTLDVKVKSLNLTGINVTDVSSGFEIDYDSSTSERKVYGYTNTSYEVRISGKPGQTAVDNLDAISLDSNIEVKEIKRTDYYIDYEIKINEAIPESVSTIKFFDKTNENVTLNYEIHIKKRLTNDELIEKITTNTYKWINLYDKGVYAILSFDKSGNGAVTYYHDLEELGTSTFKYTINAPEVSIEMINVPSNLGVYNYNSGEITFDGNKVTLRVNVTDYVHNFEIVA